MIRQIHSLMKSRSEAYKSGNPDLYRKFRYNLHKAIGDAKRQHQTKLETQTIHTDIHHSWEGLHNIMDQKAKLNRITSNSISLPDNLITFEAHFEQKVCSIAISMVLHLSLEYLDNKDTYIRILLIDYMFTFNIIIPNKFQDLDLDLCNWILDFQTNRLQSVRIGWISNNDETEYRKEIETEYKHSNPSIDISKTEKLVIDFRKWNGGHVAVCINGAKVEMADTFIFNFSHSTDQRLRNSLPNDGQNCFLYEEDKMQIKRLEGCLSFENSGHSSSSIKTPNATSENTGARLWSAILLSFL
eukprot:g45810.t1